MAARAESQGGALMAAQPSPPTRGARDAVNPMTSTARNQRLVLRQSPRETIFFKDLPNAHYRAHGGERWMLFQVAHVDGDDRILQRSVTDVHKWWRGACP